MRKIIFLLFIMVWGGILPKLYGQKEMNTWILGAGKLSPTDDTVANQILCASTLNFNSTLPILGKTCKFLPSWGNHVSICDKTGQLLFYSNGSKIFNYRHLLIENADSLNEGLDQDKIGYYYRTIVVIPNPYNNSQYYFISQFLIGFTSYVLYVTSYVLLLEITTTKNSTIVSNVNLYLFVVGELLALLIGYVLRNWHWINYFLTFYSILIVLMVALVLPESPRYLVTLKKYRKA